jgi:hypothetical protein
MQKYLSGDQHVTLQHQKPKYYVRIMQRENPKRKPNGRQLASIEAPKASRGPPGPLHARSIAPRRECCLRACAEPNVLLQKGAHQQKIVIRIAQKCLSITPVRTLYVSGNQPKRMSRPNRQYNTCGFCPAVGVHVC